MIVEATFTKRGYEVAIEYLHSNGKYEKLTIPSEWTENPSLVLGHVNNFDMLSKSKSHQLKKTFNSWSFALALQIPSPIYIRFADEVAEMGFSHWELHAIRSMFEAGHWGDASNGIAVRNGASIQNGTGRLVAKYNIGERVWVATALMQEGALWLDVITNDEYLHLLIKEVLGE